VWRPPLARGGRHHPHRKALRAAAGLRHGQSRLAHYARLTAADLAPRSRLIAIAVGAAATSALDIVPPAKGLHGQLEQTIPLRRIGDLGEVAAAVVFLASPTSGYSAGKILEVDGAIDRANLELGISTFG